MPLIDDIVSFFSRHRGYFFGKALLMAAVAGASTFFGGSILIPGMVIVGGGLALRAYGRFSALGYYKQEMVDLYRDDIAQHLGIAPEQVTIGHLKEAAKENEVIAQALERQQKKTFIEVGTSLLTAAVTFGLFYVFGDASAIQNFVAKDLGLGQLLGNAVNFIGLSTVGSFSGLVLHDGLSLAIGARTGTLKAAAHDLILAMDHDVRRGRPISREQIYGVLVAGNPQLEERIRHQFHKSYSWMSAAEKSNVLHTFGIAAALDDLAQQINNGEIRPGRLAYLMDDDALHTSRAAQTLAISNEPAQEKSNFVERLGLSARSHEGFAAKLRDEESTPTALVR